MLTISRVSLFSLIVAIAGLSCQTADAAPYSVAEIHIDANSGSGHGDNFDFYSSTFDSSTAHTSHIDDFEGNAQATGSISLTPMPTLSASGQRNGLAAAAVHLSLFYYFDVNGPAGVTVPLLLTASADAQALDPTHTDGVGASVQFWDAHYSTFLNACACATYPSSFSGTTTVYGTGGTTDYLWLALDLELTPDLNGTKADVGTAYIDPTIIIDPTFARASEFSLVFGPGVGNTPLSATPLPATLPLLASALGVMGVFGWRRKRNAVAPAA